MKDDSGSIAVIVIGLFVLTVASLMVMTDVSTVIIAKRSLAQATEAAAQRGIHTLDKSSYYQGKANIFTVPLAAATTGVPLLTRKSNPVCQPADQIPPR